MSMQSSLEEFTSDWGGPPYEPCPIWETIGDHAGELEVSLHRAAARGDVAAMSCYVDAGLDINARCARGDTALNWAIKADEAEAVRLLLSRGADLSLRGWGGSDSREGDYAVLCAARFNKVAVMKVLIESGVGIRSEALGLTVSHSPIAKAGDNFDML
jgi:ankyrin repeat protein